MTAEQSTERSTTQNTAADWDSCAAVIARADQRLTENALAGSRSGSTTSGNWNGVRQYGPTITEDVLDSISAVCRVEFSIEDSNQSILLGTAGKPADGLPSAVEAKREICGGFGCSIRVWFDLEVDRQPILETTEALAEMFSNAAAKAILQDVLAFTKLTTEFANAPSRLLHQIAQLLAQQLHVERLSLVDSRRRAFLASSEQPHVDAKSDLAIETVQFATGGNPSEEHDRFVIASFCEGHIVAIAEPAKTNLGPPASTTHPSQPVPVVNHLSDSCPPIYLACQAAIADAVARTGVTALDRLKSAAPRRNWYRGGICAVVVLLALVFIPIPVQVKARGRLVPVSQHRIFASMQGEVKSVSCQPGQRVRRGELLCQLTSYDLDSRETELQGELLTTKEQLQVAISNRGDTNAEMTSQRQVLEVRVESVQNLLAEIAERRKELTVRSPMDGIVEFLFEDESQQVSAGRPVRPGQAMFRVIDPGAGFRAELDIPDDQIGYVVSARRDNKEPLSCVFRIRSSPHVDHTGRVIQVSNVTHITDGAQLVVRSMIEPDKAIVSEKSETGLLGWVRCRSAPAGFVLFRRVIEAIRMRGG